MAMQEQGKRFSHLYGDNSAPKKDSDKARFRLSKLVQREYPRGSTRHRDYSLNLEKSIEIELGIKFRTRIGGYRDWDLFFNRITVVEMLDTITLIAQCEDVRYNHDSKKFISEAQRIFKEENLAYEIDDEGGVHPLVDSAFSAAKQSAISSLDGPRYSATIELVEGVDSCLLQNPPEYIGAIRSIFGASENLFKLMYSSPRLDARTAGEKIGKDQQAFYAGHPTQQSASTKTLEGFKGWINAAHFYRHEQGSEEPSQPPEELAILLISQGLAFVRWLAKLDSMKERG